MLEGLRVDVGEDYALASSCVVSGGFLEGSVFTVYDIADVFMSTILVFTGIWDVEHAMVAVVYPLAVFSAIMVPCSSMVLLWRVARQGAINDSAVTGIGGHEVAVYMKLICHL